MDDLKAVFKQAAEIAQQVPENMQEAAFNRALDLLTSNSDEERVTRAKHSRNRKAKQHPVKGSLTDSASEAKAVSPRKSSSSLGPKSAVAWLMQSGFFATGKTRAEVQEYLRRNRGYNIGTDQLGMAMLRLVREGVLERAENADGQYEFKRPKSQ